jgi:hypothetical protein
VTPYACAALRLRGTRMIAAVALIAADGRTIVDHGPSGKKDEKRRKREHRPSRLKQVEVIGKTELSLYSRKGSIVRIRPQ